MGAARGSRSIGIHGGAMNRIDALNRFYEAANRIARYQKGGIEISAVEDPAGARFDAAVRRLIALAKSEDGSFLDDIVCPAKALRWRRITQAQPVSLNPGLHELVEAISEQARRLKGAIRNQDLLDELVDCASGIARTDSGIGSELMTLFNEVGVGNCVVVAASRIAADGLISWLGIDGLLVATASEAVRARPGREWMYVIGPPVFFPASLVTAPITDDVSFLIPEWFRNRDIPRSRIAAYAEGAILVEARVFGGESIEGAEGESSNESAGETEYLPQPIWGERPSGGREPKNDEVTARKLYLSGGYAMWLDDGSRIRSLDPSQPCGERVTYTEVPAVQVGTYLLLREGATERSALYRAALDGLGPKEAEITATQKQWKRLLALRLRHHGHHCVERDLRNAGVQAVDQVRAWIDPILVRPKRKQDFEILLRWLDIAVHPTLDHASELRSKLYHKIAQYRKQLEEIVSSADLAELERVGHIVLDARTEGFRGILATKVLAVSPFKQIISRHDARVPFVDSGGRWLE